jgi:Protein of unknown function (DUF3499)
VSVRRDIRRDTATNAPVQPAAAGSVSDVSTRRRCSRTACGRPAIATLTYVYAESTAVVGPLAAYAEPHCYDLCELHAEGLTAPRGWDVVRLAFSELDAIAADDLSALVDAVRDERRATFTATTPPVDPAVERRSRLRVIDGAE